MTPGSCEHILFNSNIEIIDGHNVLPVTQCGFPSGCTYETHHLKKGHKLFKLLINGEQTESLAIGFRFDK